MRKKAEKKKIKLFGIIGIVCSILAITVTLLFYLGEILGIYFAAIGLITSILSLIWEGPKKAIGIIGLILLALWFVEVLVLNNLNTKDQREQAERMRNSWQGLTEKNTVE